MFRDCICFIRNCSYQSFIFQPCQSTGQLTKAWCLTLTILAWIQPVFLESVFMSLSTGSSSWKLPGYNCPQPGVLQELGRLGSTEEGPGLGPAKGVKCYPEATILCRGFGLPGPRLSTKLHSSSLRATWLCSFWCLSRRAQEANQTSLFTALLTLV